MTDEYLDPTLRGYHKEEHLDKMKEKCEAKRTCSNTDLHYCEACDLTLCSKHYR